MRSVVTGIIVLMAAGGAWGSDWPQFRGPNRDGTAPDVRLARSWPGGPKVLWTVKVGVGFGGPAIQGGNVYILDRVARRRDVLRCLDLKTGNEKWTFGYDAPGRVGYDGSRSTPTVGEKYVFTIGPFGHMHCVDKQTHKAVWAKQLSADFGSRRPQWGFSQSPLLYKDTVIIAPLSGSVGVVALKRATGKVVWKSPPFGPMRYMSPQVTTIGGVEQILMMSKSHTAGVEPGTGKVLWKYGGWRCSIPINNPLPAGKGLIFISGGYGAGSVMIRVEGKAGRFSVKEVFRLRRLGAHIHPPILHKGHLYVQFNTKREKDGLACVDLKGNVKWKTGRRPNFDWGGMIWADDHVLAMDGATGILRLIKPDPQGYKEVAKASILGGRQIWGPMALADGKLVLRDQRQMKCLEVGAK